MCRWMCCIAEGAARETWEEAEAKVQILGPFAHYDIPRIGQVKTQAGLPSC